MGALEACKLALDDFLELFLKHHDLSLVQVPSGSKRHFLLTGIAFRVASERSDLVRLLGKRRIVLVTPSVEVDRHRLIFTVDVNDLGEAPVIHLITRIDKLM